MRVPIVLIATACSAASLVASGVAHATENACTIHFERASNSTPMRAWEDAVRDVERTVRDTPGDCASIDIRAGGLGAVVDLRTNDGREAHRRIAHPDELRPLVRALLVTTPAGDVDGEGDGPPATSVDGAPIVGPMPPAAALSLAPSVDEPGARASSAAAERDEGPTREKPKGPLLFGAAMGGARFGAGDPAPVAHVQIGALLGAHHEWELAGFGRFEGEHGQVESRDNGSTSLTSAGGGASFGRRLALGPTVWVLAGNVGVFSLQQEHHKRRAQGATTGGSHEEEYFADPRAGLSIACVTPASSFVRTRVQLGGDVALLDHPATSAVLPGIPRWGLGLTIGVEIGRAP